MSKAFERLRITIYLIMCILLTFLLFAYLNEVFVGSSDTWLFSAIAIILTVIGNYFLRKYVTNLICFLLAHVIFIAFPFILPIHTMAKVLLIVVAASYLIMGINYWKLEEDEQKNVLIETPLSLAPLFILAYIHGSFSFSDAFTGYAYLSGVAFFLLYFIREYLDKFKAMSVNTSNNKSEILSTFKTNFSLVLFLNTIIMAAISISYIFYSDKLINKIASLFQKFFHYIFSLLLKDNEKNIVEEIETTAPPSVNTGGTALNTTTTNDKRDFPIIDLIFEALVYVIFIALFVAAIYLIYTFIKQYLNRNRESNDVIEKITSRDETKKISRTKSKKNFSFFTSNDIKLRKVFTKKVNSITDANSDIKIKKTYTSDDICSSISKASSINKNNIKDLTVLYKEARYSNHTITKSDVDLAIKLAK